MGCARSKSVDALELLSQGVGMCARSEVMPLARYLRKNGHLVNNISRRGRTMLHVAVHTGNLNVCEVLCAFGADPNVPSEQTGDTPLHYAVNSNRLDIVQLFMQHSGDANALNKLGTSPVHVAVEDGKEEIARVLLRYGGNPLLPDRTGQTALDLAQTPSLRALCEKYTRGDRTGSGPRAAAAATAAAAAAAGAAGAGGAAAKQGGGSGGSGDSARRRSKKKVSASSGGRPLLPPGEQITHSGSRLPRAPAAMLADEGSDDDDDGAAAAARASRANGECDEVLEDDAEEDGSGSDCSSKASSAKREACQALRNIKLEFTLIPKSDLTFKKSIGMSTFAQVFLAEWRSTKVAVKKLFLQDDRQGHVRTFIDEMNAMRQIRNHPNIVLIMGVCIEPPTYAIVMEYMPNGSIYDLLHKRHVCLTHELATRMALDIARGMAFLHTHNPPIAHRDLKTPNLLLDESLRVKIADFGLTREAQGTLMQTAVGTPAWMAPEVLRSQPYSIRADIYSYGIILWELFTGQVPHDGLGYFELIRKITQDGVRPIIPGSVPAPIAKLIELCWHEQAHMRPSFPEIIKMLEQFQRVVGEPSSNLISEIRPPVSAAASAAVSSSSSSSSTSASSSTTAGAAGASTNALPSLAVAVAAAAAAGAAAAHRGGDEAAHASMPLLVPSGPPSLITGTSGNSNGAGGVGQEDADVSARHTASSSEHVVHEEAPTRI